MPSHNPALNHHRLTQAQKNANNKQYYKQQADYHDRNSFNSLYGFGRGNYSEYQRMRINYDLMNNKIDPRDFEYVTRPWGDDVGELPAQLTNRDILSSKIKAVLGIESRRPFNWKVIAVNEEATTRKEQEEFGRLKQWVVSQIMTPIEQEIAAQVAMESNPEMSQEEIAQLQQQVAQQLEAATPPEVKKYMMREHQDPAEVLGSQLLAYLTYKERLKFKFNKGAKHAAISGREIYYVGISNGEPVLETVNPLFVDFDKSPDIDFIEDGEWVSVEYRMTPSEVISEYGQELSPKEIDDIYATYGNARSQEIDFHHWTEDNDQVRVLHTVWKSLRKIGFLTYIDQAGELQEKIVNEDYKLNEQAGDIDLRWEWIPEVHEATKIGSEYYVRMRPLPNQFKDMDNLYECKLPYVGAVYDNDNSESTSLVDRMRPYQYLYDIILYRAELLMAQDKGKKVIFDIGSVPRSNGITLKMHEYYLDANSIGYLNPKEEGKRYEKDIGSLVKEIDLSNTSDIAKYIDLAQYIQRRCGDSVGITEQLEGQIQEREAVQNVSRAVSLSTNILEDFFQKHDEVKQRVLQRLLECAKVAYTMNKPRKLAYVMDDMTTRMLSIDQELLDGSTYGVFVTNSGEAFETKEMLISLAQAALQNQMVSLSHVLKVLQSDSTQEAEEILQQGEFEKREEMMALQKMQAEEARRMEQMKMELRKMEMAHEEKMLRLEETLKKERELQKQAILALGFVGDGDINQNRIPDVVDILDKLLENKKLNLEAEGRQQELSLDKEKLEIERQKVKKENKK